MSIKEEKYGAPKYIHRLSGRERVRKKKNGDLGRVTYIHEIISKFEE